MNTTTKIVAPRKLIEVALPIDAINEAAVRESFIYRGNPSALHKWWAQRPLAAARGVLFAQLVNDPAWKFTTDELQRPGIKSSVTRRRNELFRLVTDLVRWESTTDERVLERARAEIRASWQETCEEVPNLDKGGELPKFLDPFAGGGTLPLEAQRLGMSVEASDLNPVAVLVNKALLDVPGRFIGLPPVGPVPSATKQSHAGVDEWSGTLGLAEDVRRYGSWLRDEAKKRIGQLYPSASIDKRIVKARPDLAPYEGKELTVIAWLWARTVRSPSPAFASAEVPLASTFVLSTKAGREVWVEPVVNGTDYSLELRTGPPPKGAEAGTKAARGANFRCLLSGSPITPDYIASEAKAGRMGARLLAAVVDGGRGRIYLPVSDEMEAAAHNAPATWRPNVAMPENPRWFSPPLYGLANFGDLFTGRQLCALSAFCDLIDGVSQVVEKAAVAGGRLDDGIPLGSGGTGARAYGEAIAMYLALSLDKAIEYNNTSAVWYPKEDRPKEVFARHAIPMVWDYPEVNPLCDIGGAFLPSALIVAGALAGLPSKPHQAEVLLRDVGSIEGEYKYIVSTDPPYYDNIGYADLSDFSMCGFGGALKGYFQIYSRRFPRRRSRNLLPHHIVTGEGKAPSGFSFVG